MRKGGQQQGTACVISEYVPGQTQRLHRVFYSLFSNSVPTSEHTHTHSEAVSLRIDDAFLGALDKAHEDGDTRPGPENQNHRHRRKWLLIFCVAHGFSVFSVLLCSRCAATPPGTSASACCSFSCSSSCSCSCSCTLFLGLVSGAKCLHKGLRQTKLNQQQQQQQ